MFFKFYDIHDVEIVANADAIQSVLYLHAEKRYVVRFASTPSIQIPFEQVKDVVHLAGFDIRYFTVYGSEVWTSPTKIESLKRIQQVSGASCGVFLIGETHLEFVTEEQYDALKKTLLGWIEVTAANTAYAAHKDAVDKQLEGFEERLINLENELDGDDEGDY